MANEVAPVKVEMSPDPVEEERAQTEEERNHALIMLKDEILRIWGTARWPFERDWFRNLLFYTGQQWITYDGTERRYRRSNLPKSIPRPVTNRFASTANVIRATITQVQPSFRASANRDSENVVIAAAGADRYIQQIQSESHFRAAKRKLSSWLVMTGNGIMMTEFDTSKETGTLEVPYERCMDCNSDIPPSQIPQDLTCPNCGGDALQENPTLTETIPQGSLEVKNVSPFDLFIDPHVEDLQDQWIVVVRESMVLIDAKERWAEHADEIEADTDQDIGGAFMSSIATSSATFSGPGSRTEFVGGNGRVTAYRLFCKRHQDYPGGFYAVVLGCGAVVEYSAPYPIRFLRTQKAFYPLVHFKHDEVPGRFWGKTPLDDLAPKQRQRNEVESLFQTSMMRMANPVWLIPQNVTHSPLAGDPGLKVTYSGMGGLKPERLPGIEPPQSCIVFLDKIDADFEEIASTFSALKGKNMGSVRAASAINMLMERGFGRFGAVFDNMEAGLEEWGRQGLEIWRQRSAFPRVQAISQVTGAWQFMEFSNSDLQDVDIRVEAGSTRPKSQAGEQMLIQTLQTMGAINPRDPEQRIKIIEKLGGLDLIPGSSEDMKVIADENAKFMQWARQMAPHLEQIAASGVSDPSDPAMMEMLVMLQMTFPLEGSALFDNHALHAVHHRRLALSEEFRALPKVLRDMLELHTAQTHLPHLLMEAQTGVGAMTLMGGQVGDPYADRQSKGGPGGASTPFGAGGSRNEGAGGNNPPPGKKTGDSIGPASMKGSA